MFNNEARDVLKIAAAMAEGELLYKSGEVEKGLLRLEAAIAASDGLVYDEPWGWMQPPRHCVGRPADGSGPVRRGRADLPRRSRSR